MILPVISKYAVYSGNVRDQNIWEQQQGSQRRMVYASLTHKNQNSSLQVCPVRGIEPLNWLVRGVFTF